MNPFNKRVLEAMRTWVQPDESIHEAVLRANAKRNKPKEEAKPKKGKFKRLR